jgi:hypothetical protein
MVGSTCLGQQQRRQDQRQHQQAGVGASRDFLHIMNGKKSKQQADKIAAGSRQQARNCNNSLKQRIAPLGSNEPPGQTLHAQPKFKSLRAMLGEYEVIILGAFWGRAAQHSRTCPVAPGERVLRRRWGGRARVQRLAVRVWVGVQSLKMTHCDQGDTVTLLLLQLQ